MTRLGETGRFGEPGGLSTAFVDPKDVKHHQAHQLTVDFLGRLLFHRRRRAERHALLVPLTSAGHLRGCGGFVVDLLMIFQVFGGQLGEDVVQVDVGLAHQLFQLHFFAVGRVFVSRSVLFCIGFVVGGNVDAFGEEFGLVHQQVQVFVQGLALFGLVHLLQKVNSECEHWKTELNSQKNNRKDQELTF